MLVEKIKKLHIKEHIAEHDIFIKKISEVEKFKDNKKMMQELAEFLKDWFLNHINKVDKNTTKTIKGLAKNDDSVFESCAIGIKSKLD
ncbi:MAG: hypothetical protein KAQ98_00965 [Bacteriovoracaceae bacterium]|nr:hypothetical protein [Bacteriovoracaceae bacterium]